MGEIKYYDGIPSGLRFDKYTKEQLSVLPPMPEVKPGEDYPERYKTAPLFWIGYRWQLIFD